MLLAASAALAFGPYVAGLVALAGSYLVYRRGLHADDNKDEESRANTVLAGFTVLVKSLQDDVQQLREGLNACQRREIEQRRREVEQQRRVAEQDARIADLERRLAQLGGLPA